MLNTVKKIGPVLELFTPERPEWRMTEIARALDMPKSSAHSLVATLAEVGLLSVSEHGRYRLGWNLLSLSERMRASMDFQRFAGPAMRALSEATQETALLAVLDRRRVIYVDRVEGNHPMVRLAGVRVGSRVPAHCTSVGKVLLAAREPDEVRAIFGDEPLKALTQNTIAELDALLEELQRVRARGYAFDLAEAVPEISCVAAPVHDRYGSAVAAISVPMPTYRFDGKRELAIRELLKATAEVTQQLAKVRPPEPAEDPVIA